MHIVNLLVFRDRQRLKRLGVWNNTETAHACLRCSSIRCTPNRRSFSIAKPNPYWTPFILRTSYNPSSSKFATSSKCFCEIIASWPLFLSPTSSKVSAKANRSLRSFLSHLPGSGKLRLDKATPLLDQAGPKNDCSPRLPLKHQNTCFIHFRKP